MLGELLSNRTRFGVTLVLGVGFAIPLSAPSSPQTAANLLAAYVLLAQDAAGEQIALSRVVIDGPAARCPRLIHGDDQSTRMTARRNPDPGNFPITVCEALYPRDGSRRQVGRDGPRLPAVEGESTRIAVLGDTGCKPGKQGDCSSPAQWPLATLAQLARGIQAIAGLAHG